MTTIFERIDEALQDNELSSQLTSQVDSLITVSTILSDLVSNPPENITDLVRTLDELPLPDLALSGDLATQLGDLQSAMPGDVSAITGDLTAGLQQLTTSIDGDLVQTIQGVIEALQSIYQLTQIDLTCAGSTDTRSTGSGNGASGEAPLHTADTGDPENSTPVAIIAEVDQALDRLPTPLNVETFLSWLHQASDKPQRTAFLPQTIPVLDDLRDPLETLLAWQAMGSTEVLDHIGDTLRTVETFVRNGSQATLSSVLTELTDIGGRARTSELAQIADDLTARLTELRPAVESGDLSGTGSTIAAINALLDQYDTARVALQTDVLQRLPELNRRLTTLPDALEDDVGHIASVLLPPGSLGHTELLASSATFSTDASEAVAALEDALDGLIWWVEELVSKINLAAVREPIQTAADQVQAAVGTLDDAMVAATLQVQDLFRQVESLLDQIDTETIAAQAEEAIQQFQAELAQMLSQLFAPVRDIISQVITTISSAVDAFDPTVVVDSLRQVIQALTGVLQDPAVVSALAEIRGALEDVTGRLEAISFAPLTDQVIAGIDEIAEILRGIDTSLLSTALQLALQAALAALPESLTPITDPLLDEFGDLIEEGPAPLLASVQDQPRRLLDQVRRFEPTALIGSALSQPYSELLTEMEGFRPTSLLDPVQQELDRLKDRLRDAVDFEGLFEPLEALFDELLQSFDRLQPSELVVPLQQMLTQAIDTLVNALPIDEVFDQVDSVLAKVNLITTIGERLSALLQRVNDMVDDLADAPGQFDAWVNAVLAKIEAIGDTSALQPTLADLSTALDETQAAALTARFNAAVDPIRTALDQLDAQSQMTALIQAYRGISRPAVEALPDSAKKTALLAVLDRFNPIQPEFAEPYQALDRWRGELAQAQDRWQSAMADWDALYHGSDGLLSVFRPDAITPAQLRQWVREALEPQFIRPIRALFTLIEPVRQIFGAFLTHWQSLITTLQNGLTELLSAPEALNEIRSAIDGLIQRLRDFNFDFLVEGLNEVFTQVRGKLEAVSPARLRQALEQAFDEMLQALDVGQLIAPADLAKLDADYAQVITKLRALDPEQLIIQVVQPEFEQKVIPLLEAFDLTPPLATLNERLSGLEDELRREMERVDEAYQAMRQAAPSLSISLDLAVDVGGLF